ncbi:YgeY family selenium metabolism-linked hydrolase [Chloroflexota bacterium]
MSDLKDKVLSILDARGNETVELLRELIRTPSVTGEEKQVAELIAGKLLDSGLKDVRIDEAGNVICKITGSGGGPVLLYNGHIDTVPVGDRSLWQFNPFGAEIVDGRIVGRGACDMKGSLAAMMMAVDTIRRVDVKLKGSLILTMVVKEENGLQEGTKYAMEEGGLRPDVALVGEATNLHVSLGCRGRIGVDIAVKGKSAHASNPSQGVNAITKMNKMIEAISDMELTRHEFLGTTTQVVTNITCQPGQLNIVPNLCTISIDRRIIPGDSLEKTKAEFRALIDRLKVEDPTFDADVETGKLALPAYTSPEEPAVKVLQNSAEQVLGRKPELSKYSFGTDASYLCAVSGIPTIGFGPGDETNAHSVNDHVSIDDLIESSKVYAIFAINLLS